MTTENCSNARKCPGCCESWPRDEICPSWAKAHIVPKGYLRNPFDGHFKLPAGGIFELKIFTNMGDTLMTTGNEAVCKAAFDSHFEQGYYNGFELRQIRAEDDPEPAKRLNQPPWYVRLYRTVFGGWM